MKLRHYLQFSDFSKAEYEYVLERTRWIKAQFKQYKPYHPLADRTLAMIFEKQSTRTRLSFEAGMHQLGGAAIFLSTRDTQLGRGEPVEDMAQVVSRMVDIVMIRTFEQSILERFASVSRVPVINGLTNEYHPCQVLGDIFTFVEHRGPISGKTVAWIGDSNNVCNTLDEGGADFRLQAARRPRRPAMKWKPNAPAPTASAISSISPTRWTQCAAPIWSPPTSGPAWASKRRTRSASATSATGRWTPT